MATSSNVRRGRHPTDAKNNYQTASRLPQVLVQALVFTARDSRPWPGASGLPSLPRRLPWGPRVPLSQLSGQKLEILAAVVNDRRLRVALEDELALRAEGDRCPCPDCESGAA